MRVLAEGEAQRLHGLLAEKLGGADLSVPEPQRLARIGWLQHRFTDALEVDAAAGPSFGRASTALAVMTAAAGLAASALTGLGNDWEEVVIVLGILVGVLTTINQVWGPSQRSVARYQAAYALRREGWNFLHDRGRYETLTPEQRLGAFMDEVNRIHDAVESIDASSQPNDTP